jgi:outer membrane protein TolC
MFNIKNKVALLVAFALISIYIPSAGASSTVISGDGTIITSENVLSSGKKEHKSEIFTVEKAIEYAKKHSLLIAAASAAEKTAKIQKDISRRSYNDTREAVFGSEFGSSSDATFLVLTGYSYRAAVFNYALAQRTTSEKMYTLESEVKNAFYTYLNNKEKEEIAKSSLTSAKERLLHAEQKLKNGTISQNDCESFNVALIKAQNDYNSAQRTTELSMVQLKYILNYPQEDELIVSGSFERVVMDNTSPEEALKKSEKSIARVNAEETLALAKLKCEKSVGHYTSGTVGAQSAKAEYAQAELNYYNTLENIRLNIYKAYNNMLTAYEALDYCDKNLALMEKNVIAAKSRYDMGTITSDTYLSTVREYESLKNQNASAELAAYLAATQYKLLYDCQNTISQEGF